MKNKLQQIENFNRPKMEKQTTHRTTLRSKNASHRHSTHREERGGGGGSKVTRSRRENRFIPTLLSVVAAQRLVYHRQGSFRAKQRMKKKQICQGVTPTHTHTPTEVDPNGQASRVLYMRERI